MTFILKGNTLLLSYPQEDEMKKLLILSTGLFFAVALFGQQKNFMDQNYIEVTAKAELKVSPNLFYISILLKEEDQKNRVSLSEMERNLFKALKKLDVDIEKDLVVKDVQSSYKNFMARRNQILLSKSFQLTVRDSGQLAKLFPALEKAGISNVSIAKVDHTDMQKYRQDVKINAIKAAKVKAEYLCTAIGQQAGRALFIRENGESSPYQRQRSNNVMTQSMDFAEMDGFLGADLGFEEIILNYSVYVCFELM